MLYPVYLMSIFLIRLLLLSLNEDNSMLMSHFSSLPVFPKLYNSAFEVYNLILRVPNSFFGKTVKDTKDILISSLGRHDFANSKYPIVLMSLGRHCSRAHFLRKSSKVEMVRSKPATS